MNANNEFFRRIRKQHNKQFLHSIDLVRIFQTLEQKERWRSLSPQHCKQELSNFDCKQYGLLAQYGGGITSANKLDSTDFVNFSRSILLNCGRFSEGRFNDDIKGFQTVIFCEGFRVIDNPWFNWLPFAPAEGEVLELKSKITTHVSNGTWHLPKSDKSSVLAGSTWNHDLTNLGPSVHGKRQIIENLDFISSKHYSTINHLSGVRSGTIDREPILGRHPEIKNFYLFNGFGSRGSTNIAKCAQEMADLIFKNIPIRLSKDLNRFL